MSVFADLVGQESAIAELKRAAAGARELVKDPNNRAEAAAMSHAWLFTGPPGSGRSLAARAFAAALECTGAEPGCGTCTDCKAVMHGKHPDVATLTTDLVTIKAEEVRAYVANSYQVPGTGNWKVFIIEDADRMVERTTNVLLKAIEEPAPRTVWMLCTAALADVLPTIRSRCRHVNLVTPQASAVAELLERSGVDAQAALVAAQAAQSHIGVARALATDENAAALRKRAIDAVVNLRTVGDVALAAAQLVADDSLSKDALAAAAEKEEAQRREALGISSETKVSVQMRGQIKATAVDAKRRATRALHDMVDRELNYMISFYRDVLMRQLEAQVPPINADYSGAIERIANDSSAQQTLLRIEALDEARLRLRSNVAPQLLLEAGLAAVLEAGNRRG